MGEVLPFVRTLTRTGDWTAGERARLHDLANRLSSSATGVEVVFGKTDAGDPWCVVKDDQEEVLVHVARIGGRFVVHHAAEDAIREGADLRATLGRVLGPSWGDDRHDVVVPLSLQGRRAHTFTAVVVATAFYYATSEEAHADRHAPEPTPSDLAAPQPASRLTVIPDEIELFATPQPAASPPAFRPSWGELLGIDDLFVPATTAVEHAARHVRLHGATRSLPETAPSELLLDVGLLVGSTDDNRVHGTNGDDRLVGGDGRDQLIGGAGNDLLAGGAGSDMLLGGDGDDILDGGPRKMGDIDLLDGGAGSDQLLLRAGVVALGGGGADSFVVMAPAETENGAPPLGIILDFRAGEGDALRFSPGLAGTIVTTTHKTDILAELRQLPGMESLPIVAGERAGIDFDGDGREDGYVLLGDPSLAQVGGDAISQALLDGLLTDSHDLVPTDSLTRLPDLV